MGRIGYCSACDRNVPVILRREADPHRTPAPGDAEALVCLDYGVRCTGALCPLFSVEGATSMRESTDAPRERRTSGRDRPEPSRGGSPELGPPAQA